MIHARVLAWPTLVASLMLVAVLAFEPRASASPALDDANRAFAEGHFEDAANRYRDRVEKDGYSAPLLLDLGNAYLRGGRPADAILAYERAGLLAPRDPVVARSLAAARAAAGIAEDRGLASRMSHFATADEWTWLGTAGIWLAVGALGGAALFPRRRPWLVPVGSTGAFAGAVAIAALLVASSSDQRAALTVRPVPVLVSPFDGAQSSFSLRAGSDVELGRIHDGYVLIRDRTGQSGWVERVAVARLIPD